MDPPKVPNYIFYLLHERKVLLSSTMTDICHAFYLYFILLASPWYFLYKMIYQSIETVMYCHLKVWAQCQNAMQNDKNVATSATLHPFGWHYPPKWHIIMHWHTRDVLHLSLLYHTINCSLVPIWWFNHPRWQHPHRYLLYRWHIYPTNWQDLALQWNNSHMDTIYFTTYR